MIDLSQLMGGKHFTIPCTISRNGHGIDLHALVDTGANGFAFIDTACAIDTAKFLNIKTTPLKEPIAVKGFDGNRGHAVTHILSLNLSIDGRRQTNVPFCILDLGNHDIILGLKWMDYFNIWLNPRSRTLVWPNDESRLSLPLFQREIRTQRQALMPKAVDVVHQQDMDARDQALEQEDARRSGGAHGQLGVKILKRIDPQATIVSDNCSYQDQSINTIQRTTPLITTQQDGENIDDPRRRPWVSKDITKHTQRIDLSGQFPENGPRTQGICYSFSG